MPARLTPAQQGRFDSGAAPAAHLDMLSALTFRAVAAGSRLGVFAALDGAPSTAKTLAERIGADPDALALLLDALCANGHLHGSGRPRSYELTDGSRRWLLSEGGFGQVAEFWSALLEAQWTNLEDSIRTGRRGDDFYGWLEREPGVGSQFQAMLAGIAESLSDDAVAALGPVCGRVLDVGGGHGVYATALLSAHPDLRATIVDLPGALGVAEQRCAAQGLTDRVELVAGDLREPLPVDSDDYDLALVFNVLHGFTAQANRTLLTDVHRALTPGGRVAVVEQLAGGPPTDDLAGAFVSLFSLNLFHTQGGWAPHDDDLRDWLADAGFGGVEARPLRGSASEWLLLADALG